MSGLNMYKAYCVCNIFSYTNVHLLVFSYHIYFLVVARCDFHIAILCTGLKYFWVYALKCFLKFRLLHFSFSGILSDVCSTLSDVEA
jgi:hypothetical protein